MVTYSEFVEEVENNYKEIQRFGISKDDSHDYLPPCEWYNSTIAEWTDSLDLQLINMTHGTLSHTDYTTPDMPNYSNSNNNSNSNSNSNEIYKSIMGYESSHPNGLNVFMLLIHIGTEPISFI